MTVLFEKDCKPFIIFSTEAERRWLNSNQVMMVIGPSKTRMLRGADQREQDTRKNEITFNCITLVDK